MTRARFAYQNAFIDPTAIVTASGEATGYPVSNLLNAARYRTWRSPVGTTDQWVKSHLAASAGITCVLLADWRAFSGGAIKIQFNTSDSWATPAFEQTFTLPTSNPTKVIALWFAARTETWVRILFVNTGAVNDYVELGIAFAGPYFEPTRTVTDDVRFDRHDPSIVRRSLDGQVGVVTRTKFYAVTAEFPYLPAADKRTFLAIYEAQGTGRPFFFAIDGDDPDQIVYGFTPEALTVQHLAIDQWGITVPFEEAR